MRSTEPDCLRGEFLLMLLVAVAIVGILAGIIVPVLANKLDDAQLRAEAETLRSLRKDFEATYDATDFNALNEASVPASGLPIGTLFTTFDLGNRRRIKDLCAKRDRRPGRVGDQTRAKARHHLVRR